MATTVVAEDTARAKPRLGDLVFSRVAMGAGIAILAALAAVFIFLAIEGVPGLAKPAEFYGDASNFAGYVAPLLFGTVLAAIIALIVAVPLSWGIALVVSHYAPKRVATPIAYLIDLLAAVPSVVFGLWGITVLAPRLSPGYVWLDEHAGWLPFFAGPASTTGRTILTAGLVLAIMVIPIITAISREVFAQTPRLHEEAALALGATRWEMIRMAVFPYARSGMVSAVMLGLGRALGETMAVAMVLSATGVVTFNLISTTNPSTIAANIALQFPESSGLAVNTLIASGLALFVITLAVNMVARWIITRRADFSGAN